MRSISNLLYTEQSIRQIERLAVASGISGGMLMEQAGKAAFEFVLERLSDARSIAVFCGCGNNGGDGYVLARLAHEKGLNVQVRYLGQIEKLKGEALLAMQMCQKAGVSLLPFDSGETLNADVFVDALLGIGLQGTVRESAKTVIEYINQYGEHIFAIDMPSGLQADTGAVLGLAVQADCTMTFIGIKQGMLTGAAPDYCGDIVCDDLDLSTELFDQTEHSASIMRLADYKDQLRPRPRTAHKGFFGHVLVIGGDYGMNGAPRMTALAAARTGGGLVTIATRKEHAAMMNVCQPELMSRGVENKQDLLLSLSQASVGVIGPGLGQSEWAKALLKTALEVDLPFVIDADALNLLADKPQHRNNWILTPHHGEAARLLKTNVKTIQNDRFSAVQAIQEQYGGVCILKGAGSIVLNDQKKLTICTKGNPGMASGGMGDLLSGIIAALIGQGLSLSAAAAFGVCLHAEAGDLSAKKNGERGLLATDLLPFLRRLVNAGG